MVMVMCFALFMGCTPSVAPAPETTEPTSSSKQPENAAPAEKPSDPEKKELYFGYAYPVVANEFWAKSVTAVEAAAAQLGVKVISKDCNNVQEAQIADVENMIASGIDGLLLAASDASVFPACFSACAKAGIPVIAIDRLPADEFSAGKDYLCFIGPDDLTAGYNILNSLYENGVRKFIAVGGAQGNSVAEGRVQGMRNALAEHPDMELLQLQYTGESMDTANDAARSLIQVYGSEIDGVWCHNDDLAMAVMNAIIEAGYKPGVDIKIAGMDHNTSAMEAIQAGTMLYSEGGHWTQSAYALVILNDYFNNFQPDSTMVRIKLLGVTKDNIDAFNAKYGNQINELDFLKTSKTIDPNATTNFELSLN